MVVTSVAARMSAPAIILAAAAIVAPSLAVLAPLGVAPLLTIVAVALLIAAPRRLWEASRPLWPFAVLSALWSILPTHSLIEGARVLAIGAEGTIALAAARTLTPPEAARVGLAAAVGTALGAGLLLFEWTTGAALTRWLHDWGQAVS